MRLRPVRFALSMLALVLPLVAGAQDETTLPYTWVEGGLTLVYPAEWEPPVPTEEAGQPVLVIAQALANAPDVRPPGIPLILLALQTTDTPDAELYPLLETIFQQLGLTPSGPTDATLAGLDGVMTTGTSADTLLFGVGRAARLADGRVLLIVGRGLAEQQEAVLQTFDTVADSITLGQDAVPSAANYGVLWHTQNTIADGPDAFVNLTGLAYGPNDRLYTVDLLQGVIQLDAATGAALARFPKDDLVTPSDIAVGDDGVVYVADVACQCIHVLEANGKWGKPIVGFGPNAPLSIAAAPDGVLYATDQSGTELRVRLFRAGQESDSLPLPEEVASQPLLVVDRSGQLLAVDVTGMVWGLADGAFVELFVMQPAPPSINDVTLDADNRLVLATQTEAILVVNRSGVPLNRIGRIVANFPLPGELVNPRGVAAGPDGTIYWADSDGTFGIITAMSTQVETGRIGATTLTLDTPVQGVLDDFTAQQIWTFEAQAGQQVTITAVDASRANLLDLALRLLAPDGTEEAFNNDHQGGELFGVFDAQIANHIFAASGSYLVVVERVAGSGTYTLGITQPRSFDLSGGVDRLQGELLDVFPTHQWVFEGRAGQVLTFTMQAESGTLDPALRLLNASGEIMAFNDDADDPALGLNAQIAQVRLPEDGTYTIEATRFGGEGRYTLNVVVLS